MIKKSVIHFVYLLALLLPGTAFACRCVTPLSVNVAYQRADLVAFGRAGQMRQIDAASQTNATVFHIDAVWKGNAKPELIIISGETCVDTFEQGTTYLIFLTKLPNGRYGTSRCAGNRTRAHAGGALAWLKRHGSRGVLQSAAADGSQ
jgi:hypothetical protein